MSHPNDLAPRRPVRPGDMCLVTGFGKFAGAIVTAIVVENALDSGILYPSSRVMPVWRVDKPFPWKSSAGRIMSHHLPESMLWPLDRGDPGEDSTETVAKKPQSVNLRLEDGQTIIVEYLP